jgi:hypothetical protein
MLKTGILFTILSPSFIEIDTEYDPHLLGLRLEIVFSRWLIGCFLATREATRLHFFAAVTPGTEMFSLGFVHSLLKFVTNIVI